MALGSRLNAEWGDAQVRGPSSGFVDLAFGHDSPPRTVRADPRALSATHSESHALVYKAEIGILLPKVIGPHPEKTLPSLSRL